MAFIPQYPTPWTGPEFEEGIMRILSADVEKFAWLWINTDENSCDLNTLKEPGCYVILDYLNGIPGFETIAPLSIMVEYHENELYQIVFIGPDCWYRIYNPIDNVWTEWKLQIEHPIFKDKNPPEEPYDGQIWLRIPDGDWHEYMIYRYDAISKEWVHLWGDGFMTRAEYDPQHYYMDMYQYFNISLKEQMSILTKHECDCSHELYKSEFYSTVAHILQVDNHYYFVVNPESILTGDNEITSDQFWILDYISDNNTMTLNEVIGSGIDGNIRQFIHLEDGYFFIRLSNGEVYYSIDLQTWTNAVHSVSTHDYLSKYTHEELSEYTHEKLSSIAETESKFPPIDYIAHLDDDRLYLFGNNGNSYFRTSENIMLLYGEKIVSPDFLIHDVVAWKQVIFIAGHMRNGDPSYLYYYSMDECRTTKEYTLPVSRKWSNWLHTEDFLLITTEDAGTELDKNTYYTIDPVLTKESIRVAANKVLASEVNKFENAGNCHDIKHPIWLPYVKELGGVGVSDAGGILIEFYITSEKVPVVEYVESHYEERIRTTYNFLTRYYYKELMEYTYDEIKYIASKIVSVMERIEFGEYQEEKVIIKSFKPVSEDSYGFIYKTEDNKIGFQTVKFEVFYETFKWHIKDWDRHITAEEREIVSNKITTTDAGIIIQQYRNDLQDYVDDKKEDFDLDDDLKLINDIAKDYVDHIKNTSIHVTPEQVARWNAKSNKDHTHFLDGKIKLSIDDFIQGTFSPDRFPLEAFRKIVTVKSIADMLNLKRTDLRNGSTVRVYDPETMDLSHTPCGRLFMVINDRQLNMYSSYLEYTFDFRNAYLYYYAITNKPTTRDDFEIIDINTKYEVDELVSYASKLNYGFETKDSGDIINIMNGYNRLLASKDFIEKNNSNMSKDLVPLNSKYSNSGIVETYDIVKDNDIFQYIDFQPWFNVPFDPYKRSIYNIVYIEPLKMYYVFAIENNIAKIYKTDFSTAMSEVYSQEGRIDVSSYAQNCSAVYLTSNYMLFLVNGNFILHDLINKTNSIIFNSYHVNCYYIEHGDDDYAAHIVYVDTDYHLHFSSITTKGKIEDMRFSHAIQSSNMIISSLIYSNGTILITLYNESEIEIWMYYHMGRFLRSKEWFEDVDIYLGNDAPVPFTLTGYTDLPQIVKRNSSTVILHQYQDPHCINLRKDQGYSYTATYLTLEKTLDERYYLRSRMLFYNENKEIDEYTRDIIEITPSEQFSDEWEPSNVNMQCIPIDEHTIGFFVSGLYTTHDVVSYKCHFIRINVKNNVVISDIVQIPYLQINNICKCADGFIYMIGDNSMIARHTTQELVDRIDDSLYAGTNKWVGNIIYSNDNTQFTQSQPNGRSCNFPFHVNCVKVKPSFENLLIKGEGTSSNYYIKNSISGDLYYESEDGRYTAVTIKSGDNKGVYVFREESEYDSKSLYTFATESDIAEIIDTGIVIYSPIGNLRSNEKEYLMVIYLYRDKLGGYNISVYSKIMSEDNSNTSSQWMKVVNEVISNIENPKLYITYNKSQYVYCYIRMDSSISQYRMTNEIFETVETYLKPVDLNHELAIKWDCKPNTEQIVPWAAVLQPNSEPNLNSAEWKMLPIMASSKILKIYSIQTDANNTERISLALGNKNEILAVSYRYNTENDYKIRSTKSKSITGLGQIVDMYVMTVKYGPELNNYHIIIFLINKYGQIYFSPLWTDTWSVLYTHDRYLLGTHNNSIYQSISSSISNIEDSL